MNEEFALDPEIAKRLVELRLLLSHFGFYEGRFISRFPRRWFAQALEGITDQGVRQRVQMLLERAKAYAFLPSGRAYDSSKRWIDNALQQHIETPFNAIISVLDQPGVIAVDDLDPRSLPGSRDARVMGSVDNIMKAIRPLLRLSGFLVLVDPYFKPWATNTNKLLNEVLTESSGWQCISFDAYVSEKEWEDEISHAESLMADRLPKTAGGKLDFKIKVCRDLETESRLHARYLFSAKGGIRLDKGLQTDRSKVDLSFIDRSVHEDLMQTFVERPLLYRVEREFSFRL